MPARVVSRRSIGQTESGPRRRPSFDPGPAWMRALPPAVMLVIAMWRITGPSYWRDEAATLTAVRRPFGELLRMLGHVDAVHGAYYVITWPLVRLLGPGELVTRLPSALAMAGAAAAVAALGRRLVSPRAGLAAGLTFAVLPQVSLYAQDAREYAIVTALAAVSSYLLVRAMSAAGRRRPGWLAGYAAGVGLMGLLSVLSLLLVAAHAVTVALRCRAARAGDRAAGAGDGAAGAGDGAAAWPLAAGWLAAAVAGVVLASPALVLGYRQRGSLSWLTRPDLAGAVEGLRKLIGPAPMLAAVALAVALGVLASALEGRQALADRWPPELLALGLPWLVLPPVVLIGVSFASPVYTFRYVLFCAPAAALLAGTGLAALSFPAGRGRAGAPAWRPARLSAWLSAWRLARLPAWAPAAACLVVIAALGVPAQLAERAPGGHGTNIRAANAIVAARKRPGDAVLYLGTDTKYFPAAYPSGFAGLDDIAQRKTPSQAGNLVGQDAPGPVIRQRLARAGRVWVTKLGSYPHNVLRGQNFRLVRAWRTSDIWLLLFARRSAT
jgi:mannosyltransferase